MQPVIGVIADSYGRQPAPAPAATTTDTIVPGTGSTELTQAGQYLVPGVGVIDDE